ncbi:MAG: hypothetical protein ABIF10_00530 [Candidatus Woesearchaeota archaeon]
MKKAISALLILMLALVSTGVVGALPGNPFGSKFIVGANFVMPLEQKNPVDWSVISKKGTLMANSGLQLAAMIHGMKPNTDYTLIYYGNAAYNDLWPYVTCIASAKTNLFGGAALMGLFNYRQFLFDGVGQKFWVVTSADINCKAGSMIAWNPNDYLFEHDTI